MKIQGARVLVSTLNAEVNLSASLPLVLTISIENGFVCLCQYSFTSDLLKWGAKPGMDVCKGFSKSYIKQTVHLIWTHFAIICGFNLGFWRALYTSSGWFCFLCGSAFYFFGREQSLLCIQTPLEKSSKLCIRYQGYGLSNLDFILNGS